MQLVNRLIELINELMNELINELLVTLLIDQEYPSISNHVKEPSVCFEIKQVFLWFC